MADRWLPIRIISGGQTGVDRAALDVAMSLGIPHGGWCPCDRLAEDGRIPDRYQLQETAGAEYPLRTERNVTDSDGTLILCRGQPGGGTDLTLRLAERHGRPCLVVDLDAPPPPAEVAAWLRAHQVRIVNVAGPRESQSPGIAGQAAEFLRQVLGA
jgi:hypothetical protein